MTSQIRSLIAQQQVADLIRTADQARLANATKNAPAQTHHPRMDSRITARLATHASAT